MIQSVSNALRLLEAFLVLGESVGVNELARHLNLSPAVTHRLLVTLRAHGFVQQDAHTRKFRIGARTLEVGLLYFGGDPFATTALQAIQETFPQYTAFVGILVEDVVLIVAGAEGNSQIRMGARTGEKRPAHTTALGKALLADLTDEAVLALVARTGMQPITPRTIVEPQLLLTDLHATRARGYAVNDEESVMGGVSIGVTLHDAAGSTLGAMAISMPKFMVTPEQVAELGSALHELAQRLQSRFAATPGRRSA